MIKIYTPNYRCNLSIKKSLQLFFNEIIKYKNYIFTSIYSDIISKYKQDNFGLLWSVILPIVPMSLYLLLASIKAFKKSEDMPYIFYITIGMMIWLLMSEIIVTTMKSLRKNKKILLKSNFPFSVVYISSIGELLVNMFIRLIFVIIIMITFSIHIDILNLFLTIFALTPIIIFAFSFGIILSISDIYIPDTKRLVDMFLRYGLFLSSVIFPFPKDGILGFLNQFNIFNTFVESVRSVLYFGTIYNYIGYTVFSIISIILFTIAIFIMLKIEFKVRSGL